MERRHHKNHDIDFKADCKKDVKKCVVDKKKCEVKKHKKCKSSSSSECEKKCVVKKHKKCKSSSSSSKECEKICVPKVVYQACINGGVASLSITATVDTPNHDNPPTFTCPANIGQQISLTFTVTNTGNVVIRSPIYIYNSFTGVDKVTCSKLYPGQSRVITVQHKVSNCQCMPGNNISIVANAYTNIHNNCLILVSQPIAIQINQA